ncbi:G5 domain-containing protein [Georgenia sunbinii]|uniref:aggregation-promoting factor C-terminal-like domain-containing protein n=1 Tax=Georgenia sunbinii TaxID=3117728 RepID=UPI002F25EE12
MPDLEPRARHREVVPPAHRLQHAARRGLRGAVLTAIVGGTLAFAVATPSTTTQPLAPVTAAAFEGRGDAVERHAAGSAVASRFESRVPLPGAAIEIVVDGEPQQLTTSATTVAEALLEAGVLVDADDVVSVPMGQRLSPGMTIAITSVVAHDRHETDTDPFETIEEEDGSLLTGEREVLTEGVDGVTATTVRITRRGEGEEDREVIARAVLSERVDEVIRVGTAEPEPEPEPVAPPAASSSSSSGSSGDAPVPTFSSGDTRAIGAELAGARGWGGDQFQCLDQLWERESNWRTTAENPSSGAYGIPQSLPGSKMASAGSDWRTNPATQITWGLDYIAGRYGTPCGALSHSHARGWY